MMVQCLARPERAVAENVCEYLFALSNLSMAERAPELRSPLLDSAFMPLMRHVTYPPDFTTWDEYVDDDQGAFDRFRCV